MAEGIKQGLPEEDIRELVKKNTRNYAKRQITFFKQHAESYFSAARKGYGGRSFKIIITMSGIYIMSDIEVRRLK